MTKFRPGDRVVVPWGLGEVFGTVVDVFGPPGAPFVMVRVELSGSDENETGSDIGFRADDVRPAPLSALG
jgi:rRNA processing protein Gar1